MKKEIKRYTFFLSLLGIINVSLIVLSINAVIVMNFPEYSGIFVISFVVLVIKLLVENFFISSMPKFSTFSNIFFLKCKEIEAETKDDK